MQEPLFSSISHLACCAVGMVCGKGFALKPAPYVLVLEADIDGDSLIGSVTRESISPLVPSYRCPFFAKCEGATEGWTQHGLARSRTGSESEDRSSLIIVAGELGWPRLRVIVGGVVIQDEPHHGGSQILVRYGIPPFDNHL